MHFFFYYWDIISMDFLLSTHLSYRIGISFYLLGREKTLRCCNTSGGAEEWGGELNKEGEGGGKEIFSMYNLYWRELWELKSSEVKGRERKGKDLWKCERCKIVNEWVIERYHWLRWVELSWVERGKNCKSRNGMRWFRWMGFSRDGLWFVVWWCDVEECEKCENWWWVMRMRWSEVMARGILL